MPRTIKIACTGAALAKLEDLVPLQGDLKKLDAAHYKKLKRAIIDHGFSFPFFVWKDKGKLKLLDGHQRDRVLRRLQGQGYEIPPLPITFIDATDETEARKKILLLTSQYGQMTDESLLEFLKQSEIDLDDIQDIVDLPHVDVDRLAQKLFEEIRDQIEGPPEQTERADALLKKWGVEPGQLWEVPSFTVKNQSHRILCGDSTRSDRLDLLMAGKKAALVFTDPPYGVSYKSASADLGQVKNDKKRLNDLSSLLSAAFKLLILHSVDEAAFYIWHASTTRADFEAAMKSVGLVERQYLIWVKPQFVLGHADYQWGHEPCFYASKQDWSPRYYGDRTQQTVWRIGPTRNGQVLVGKAGLMLSDGHTSSIFITAQSPRRSGKTAIHVRVGPEETISVTTAGNNSTAWEVSPEPREEYLHPTQKPTELARIAIQNSSMSEDIVLDTFGGAGGTAVACEQLGRICYIMDEEAKYVAVILERLAQMGLTPQLLNKSPTSAKRGAVSARFGGKAKPGRPKTKRPAVPEAVKPGDPA